MKKFKKALSLLLCAIMIFGTVAIAGTSFLTKTYAAVGTSVVKDKAYFEGSADVTNPKFSADCTTKPYIYMAIDYYESNGKLTDYYVDAGETLTAFVYLKSNMYFNTQTIYLEYDNTFFDVTNGSGQYLSNQSLQTNSYVPGATTTYKNFAVNADHTDAMAVGLYGTWLEMKASGIANATSKYPEIADQLSGMDVISTSTKRDTAENKRYKLDTETYLITFQIKVKSNVADNAKGSGGALINLYSAYKDSVVGNQRLGKFSVATSTSAAGRDSVLCGVYNAAGNFLIDDAYATFTCGENPNAEGGKKTAIFINNDGEEVIFSKAYDVNEAIEDPDMSEYTGFIGWADKNGNVIAPEDFDVKMGTSALTFKAVYDTDKFDVVINFNGGNINGKTSETVSVKYNEAVDLSKYVPTRTGYDFNGYEPATVKVENVLNIASPKAKWTAKQYDVKFYLNKSDVNAFATVKATYDATLVLAENAVNKGFNFAAWKDKSDDSVASTKVKFNNKWTVDGDKEYYATWTAKDFKFTFMLYDYSKGEWKEFETAYGNNGEICTNAVLDGISKSVTAQAAGWDGEIQVGSVAGNLNTVFTKAADSTIGMNVTSGIKFEKNETFYIQTKLIYDLEVNVPVFNGTKYTSENTTHNFKVASGLSTSANPYAAKQSFEASKYVAADGYEFVEWVITNDKLSASTIASGTSFAISGTSTDEYVATAKFDLVRYKLRFYINDSTNTAVVAEAYGQIGKEIKLDGNFKIENSEETFVLPTAGVENSEQTTPYSGRNGYKSVGFSLYEDKTNEILSFPLVLTQQMVADAKAQTSKIIDFKHIWEALEYDATFKYKDVSGTEKVFTVSGIPVGTDFNNYDPSNKVDETLGMAFGDYVRANAPEGYKFDRWDVVGSQNTTMEAGGKTFEAVYSANVFKIFVYLNRGGELADDLVKKFTSSYGDDIEAPGDTELGIEAGKGAIVKNMTFTETEKPTPDCEYIGWKVYHLKDESKGELDKSNWVEGVNDEGTTVMRGTVIYEPEWKLYNEFFFRVYGNGGTEDLYSGFGKNFKMYYWKNHRPCQKGDEVLNKTPELNVILGFMPSLENFDFARFFDASMWKSIYLRFDAISVPRSLFTWAGFSGLVTAAWNAIVGLIKGEG